jgi:hypothetical protein
MIQEITFFSLSPSDRILKIAAALKAVGIKCVGIFNKIPVGTDVGKYFDTLIVESDQHRIPKIVQTYSKQIIHIFSLSMDGPSFALKDLRGRVIIYDFKDIFTEIHPRIVDPLTEKAQKYILQNANGLVMRDGQAFLAAMLGRFKLASNRILFPDFCWPTWMLPEKFLKPSSGPYHLVHIGMVQDETLRPDRAGAGQSKIFSRLLENGHKIDYYPGPANSHKLYPTLYKLHTKWPTSFKMCESLCDTRLLAKLGEYDFGLRLSQSYYFPNMPVYWHPKLARYGVGARLFSYLSAGIPILASPDDYGPRLAVKKGLGITLNSIEDLSLDGSDFNIKLSKIADIDARRETVKRLGIDNHIQRLIAFYEASIKDTHKIQGT